MKLVGWRWVRCFRCWGRGYVTGAATTVFYTCPDCGGADGGYL